MLVTGGAGFIGSHIVDALVARGDEVVVVDDLSKGTAGRVDGARLVTADIRDGDAVERIMRETTPRVVFHMAAQADVRVSVADPARDADVNVLGTIRVADAARRAGARVVFASTGGALYGETDERPTPESHPAAPEAPYGTAKLCAEEYLRLFDRLHATRNVVLRLGNVYGPRQDPSGEAGVVSIFAGRVVRGEPPTVFGDGQQTRDYIYVGDVVRGFLAAADADRSGVWNIGTGVETSVLGLLDALADHAGTPPTPVFAPARAGELQRSCLAVGAARRDLGFAAQVGIRDGAGRVYDWVARGEPVRGDA